jgi:hypothetical protein
VIHPLTEETAAAERRRILAEVRFHRNAAKARLRDLERFEDDCARVGIRLIRTPARPAQGRDTSEPQRPDHR